MGYYEHCVGFAGLRARVFSYNKRTMDRDNGAFLAVVAELPHRLRPGTSPQALQIPSCDTHLMDTLPSEVQQAVASGRSWLVSSFRLRARLDVSTPSPFSGQRGYQPRFLDMAPLI
jgi:hypothetical protein